ncbi:hypothetical protein DDZ13_06575 [Coraliomargarita sinensis]|uniref:Uncharacterized protein n=1 Tax=Coraliomargarita sinensis TaxID=2174842 RepID=A0A317ZGP8_9BACT|nr:hypothetical protein [Coraliomargarita sinensis]PXA04824.1 hypothetical protein DDZ13_06575 [Coraliomargarita sinensis]
MDLTSYTYPGLDLSQPTGKPQNESGGFLGDDGFLSKAGETALDIVGLYGQYDLEKRKIETAGSNKNPEIAASQARAGVVPQFIVDNRVPLYIVGGIAAVGVIAAITITASRRK